MNFRGGTEVCPLQRTHRKVDAWERHGFADSKPGRALDGADSPSWSLLRKAKASGLFPEWQVRSLGTPVAAFTSKSPDSLLKEAGSPFMGKEMA